MSEVQSRPARGRTTTRGGGRGGHGSRGPRSNKQPNGESSSAPIDTSADQGELGELKRRYQSQLSTLKEVFPDWADADLVLAVEESDGDLQATIEKISEGNVSQFAEVKKTKDRSRSKVKETGATTDAAPTPRGTRGDRRGGDSVRGGRGRGTDRGRGGFRGGARGGATNGTRATGTTSVPTADAWGIPAADAEAKENEQPTVGEAPVAAQAEPEVPKAAPAAVAPPKKTWASMFAAPKPVPTPAKPVAQPTAFKEEPAPVTSETSAHEVAQEAAIEAEDLPIPPVADEVPEEVEIPVEDTATLTPEKPAEEVAPEIELTPSKDELTKDNVEHLPDISHPPQTETAASTVASSRDIGVATPLSTTHTNPLGRPAIGGFATTALKATGVPHRSASYQRRLMEQQEAVVLPGNHAVDRAAVQFGSLGLNGDVDSDNLDVDEDREEAETRTQPPQHSPVAQPRAALPPAPRQAPQAEAQPQESHPTPKQAPGLPPVPQQQPISQQSPSEPLGAQPVQNQGAQGNQPYSQFGRYGQGGIQSEQSAPPQKPYDPFGQQAPQTSQYDYNQQQSQNLAQQQSQSQAGAFSSAPDSFASQYLTSEQRSAYQNYYGGYGQQSTPSQQEAGSAQQRSGSAFGADSSFSQSQQQGQGRYNEAQNSGHTTPNPALGGQHPSGPGSQGQHIPQQHAQQPGGHSGGYPYNHNHPIYNTPQYAAWMSQFGGMYGQGGYGSFGNNKGMYGQPHHYGMSPQASYDNQHSSSPANAGGFGASSMHGRESGLGGGLGEFGRSASGTSQNQHGATAGGYGGFPDVLGRSQGGYPNNQTSSYGQQQVGQQASNEDSLKPFGDSKSGGPSPSALGAQQGRPGSATNNNQGQSGQGGLPNQSHQQGFGGYPGHLGHQYGGLGGLGHQGGGSHQGGGYGGNYGGFGGGYGSYGSYGRGGWGGNYGGQH